MLAKFHPNYPSQPVPCCTFYGLSSLHVVIIINGNAPTFNSNGTIDSRGWSWCDGFVSACRSTCLHYLFCFKHSFTFCPFSSPAIHNILSALRLFTSPLLRSKLYIFHVNSELLEHHPAIKSGHYSTTYLTSLPIRSYHLEIAAI